MSADVCIGPYSYNYTHNLSALWYDHIPDSGKGGGLREIDGVTGKQALLILSKCFEAINDTRYRLLGSGAVGETEMHKRYDAPNGWGSLVGGILFLANIMAACALCPRHIVRVSL